MQQMLLPIVEHRLFRCGVIVLILINAGVLGLETSKSVTTRYGELLSNLDTIILYLFVIEILLRFLAYGKEFFKDGWNWFDVIIVGISFAPTTDSLSVLRTLRVLRVLRLLSMIPAMRRVIEGLFEAIPGLLSVIAILMIINYVFAVIMTMQYGEAFPVMFGTLGKSLYTLFQVMTLEAWSSEVARPVMEQFPQAWFMFLLYILLTSFTILNLVIGVVVNAMQSKSLEEEIMHHDDVKEEVRALRREIRTLKKAVEK